MANITRYDPFGLFSLHESLVDTMDRLMRNFPSFGGFDSPETARAFSPTVPTNIYETGEAYQIVMALPGVDPKKLDVTITGQVLTISGTRQPVVPEGAQPIWRGIPEGEFRYSLTLPAPVDVNQIEAASEHGMLVLTLPKAEAARSRQITVKVGEPAKQLEAGKREPVGTAR